MPKAKTIIIIGASGFIGHNLIKYLLKKTDYRIRAFARHASDIKIENHKNRVKFINGDAFDQKTVESAVRGSDAVIYLLHMMAEKGDYVKKEAKAAEVCGQAIANQKIPRVVFMGGLGNDKDKLSKHLKSRHRTGEILRRHVNSLIELRASMIIGKGSVAYEIMKRLVNHLPVQTLPKWATTMTQPISIGDALAYILASIELKNHKHEIIEIGGPRQMSYKDLIKEYGNYCGKKLILIEVPIVPLWLGAWWLNLFTPSRQAKVGRQMVESLMNPMVVNSNKAHKIFPDIKPTNIIDAFEREE